MLHHTRLYSPPTSPPSSPFHSSSSPPSSPQYDFATLDSDGYDSDALGHHASSSSLSLGNGSPMDPLAGSYRPLPGKRASAVACSPMQTPLKKKARFRSRTPDMKVSAPDSDDSGSNEGGEREKEEKTSLFELEMQRQKELWDSAIERAFDTGDRKIDLTDQNIVDVPAEIVRDLAKIVVLSKNNEPVTVNEALTAGGVNTGPSPFTAPRTGLARTHTTPGSNVTGWARYGSTGKAMSSNSILGLSRDSMDLFLGKNNISRLPMELWYLHNLTVLSLRNNSLTYIPPEIANLKDLQTLNLAHNKLRFIPSEMLQMKNLKLLNLFPNPFKPQPLPNSKGKYVSKTELRGTRVPPLTELALRALLSRKQGSSETMLEQYYELPLATSHDQRPISAFRDIFSVCVPGSVLPDRSRSRWRLGDEDAANMVTGIGICSNPAHEDQSTFIRPAEERFTWEQSTVSIDKLGGAAAVLWRGCMWGCLDFLGMAKEDEDREQIVPDDNMDVDLQESDVVQAVRFATELDFED